MKFYHNEKKISLGKSNETSFPSFLRDLDEDQIKPTTHLHGPLLVKAGAGSGKTRVLTYRTANLIHQGVPDKNIMLLTFTNKSAKEMMQRIKILLENRKTQIMGGTFHSIGNIILSQFPERVGYRKGHTIMDTEDQNDLLDMAKVEANISTKDKMFPKSNVIKEIYSLAHNRQTSYAEVIQADYPHFLGITDLIEKIISFYTNLKIKNNVMDYDDLLVLWYKLLAENEDIRKRFHSKHIMIDEFQDTNLLQFEIIKMMAGEENHIMAVGDANQSIYRWRAAEINNILEFPAIFKGCTVYEIPNNYRSTPQILHFANHGIQHNQKKSGLELKPTKGNWEKPYVIKCPYKEEEAQFIAERILMLREEGVSLNDIGILYRSHYIAQPLEIELTKRNIPYKIYSGKSFFERKHIKDVISFTKIFHNSKDNLSWMRILCLLDGIGKETAKGIIQHLSQIEDVFAYLKNTKEFSFVKRGKKSWEQFVDLINSVSLHQKPSEMIQFFIEKFYKEYAKFNLEHPMDRLQEIQTLGEFSIKYNSLGSFINEIVLLREMEGLQSENKESQKPDELLTLSSIHSAKGLEWKYVFIMGCRDGQFPSELSKNDAEMYEEERRLFYVAATRAEKELYLTYSVKYYNFKQELNFGKISPFIKEIEKKFYEEYTID